MNWGLVIYQSTLVRMRSWVASDGKQNTEHGARPCANFQLFVLGRCTDTAGVRPTALCLLGVRGCGWILSEHRLSHRPHVYSTPRAAAWTAFVQWNVQHLPPCMYTPNEAGQSAATRYHGVGVMRSTSLLSIRPPHVTWDILSYLCAIYFIRHAAEKESERRLSGGRCLSHGAVWWGLLIETLNEV